tara:strand:+ start:2474 stop:3523 length:1050 start_codon:yes stop_codon:yes gene_type:complete
MSERKAEGYDILAVEQWISQEIPALAPPFEWARLEGGHSNLTYLLQDQFGKLAVIRRPPKGELLPKAHDMSREWALISSLGAIGFPVPAAYGFCESNEVTGAWFYVMDHVEGRSLHNAQHTLDWVPEDRRTDLAYSLIDALADLHVLNPDDIGLGELGKKGGYVARQLNTWYRSWTASIRPAGYDDDRVHELHQYFTGHIPEQGIARVVHGDFGFHNCLVNEQSTIAAVVDWELASLGDPLADLGYTLNLFGESQTEIDTNPEMATSVPGFPPRSSLAARYAERTGRALEKLDYYRGFNYWKRAVIVHGVYARYAAGQKSTEGIELNRLLQTIDSSLSAAKQAVDRLEY